MPNATRFLVLSTATLTIAASACAPSSTGASTWTVRPDGIGPLHVGMTSAAARAALGLPTGSKGASGCDYLAGTAATPLHANVMLTNDTVVRFDVRDSSIATAEGARVGDSETRVQQLYQGRIAVQPHKYLAGGHYLVVTPA